MTTKRFLQAAFDSRFYNGGENSVELNPQGIDKIIQSLSFYLNKAKDDYSIQKLNDMTTNVPPNSYAKIKMVCSVDSTIIYHKIPILYDRDDQSLVIREIRNIISLLKMIKETASNIVIKFIGGFERRAYKL